MAKMKFEIEFEVPEDIESFIGIELSLQSTSEGFEWRSVFADRYRLSKVRDGKHLKFNEKGYRVISVGERTPEEIEILKNSSSGS